MTDERSPGWDAIDEALRAVYGDAEPKHFGTVIKWRLGGPDPLDGVSIYESTSFGVPHWHYVSYGLTELYEKESDDTEESGWGFELTFRLRRATTDQDPPIWPINLMQNLARYVFSSGATFSSGHHMNANGPIALDRETKLTTLLFVDDPELTARATPHGRVRFVQVVGATLDELDAARAWNTDDLLALLAQHTPGWVSDLDRASSLDDARTRAAVKEGIERDGSSMGLAYTDQLALAQGRSGIVLTIGALSVEQLLEVIPGRLRFGRPLAMVGSKDREVGVQLEGGDEVALTPGDADSLPTLSLPPSVVTAFAERVRPKAGSYEIAPGLTVVVKKTDVRSHDGKRIVHTIG